MTHKHELPFFRPNGKMIYFEKSELLKWMRSGRELTEKEIEKTARLKIQELAMKSLKRKKWFFVQWTRWHSMSFTRTRGQQIATPFFLLHHDETVRLRM